MSNELFGGEIAPWKCPYCTVINKRSTVKCETCYQNRPGHRKRQGGRDTQSQWWPWKRSRWSCNKCTYSNNPIDPKCALCGTEKKGRFLNFFRDMFTTSKSPEPLSIPPPCSTNTSPVHEGWICSQCTYLNDPSAIECEECSNSKAQDGMMDELGYDIVGLHDRSHDNVMLDDDKVIDKRDMGISVDKEDDNLASWICADCTFDNNIVNTKCSACGSTNRRVAAVENADNEVSSTHWACSHCSMQNSNSDLHCSVCGVVRKKIDKKEPSFDPAIQWKCTNCSLHNNIAGMQCMACGCDRYSDMKDVDDDITQWQCVHCSMYNSASSDMCSACGGVYRHKVSLVTRELSSSMESSMRKTRLYSTSTALVSISVKDKRQLIDQDAMKCYQQILQFCIQDKSSFVDPDFPPNDLSLYRDPTQPSHYWKVTQWCRPAEIKTHDMHSSAKWTVYRNPEPGDIAQGVLGTCWFLSALSVLAEKPELVEQIIVNKQYTEYGIYLLRLCKDGCWSVIQVDDNLPCNKHGMLVFSKGLRRQLWVPLIEKALAKLYGTYEAIEAGFVLNGLSILTGYPCENIKLQSDGKKGDEIDNNLLWAQLLSFRDAGFLMGASCGGRNTISLEECEVKGLQFAHAYSILDVQQVQHHRLLKLRNPHGHGARKSWNGDWSDESSRWSAQLKQQLLPHGASEGIFWICLRDLMIYFSDVDVCRYRPSWFVERVKGELLSYVPNKMSVMAVEILQTCEVDICLYQATNRRKMLEEDSLVDIAVIVMRYSAPPDDMMLDNIPLPTSCVVYSNSNIKSSVSLSAVLDPGFYAIVPLSFNTLSEFCLAKSEGATAKATAATTSIPYSLAFFSSKPIVADMGQTRVGFLSHSLFLMAQKCGNKNIAYNDMWVSEVYLRNSCRVIVAENHATFYHFMVTMQCSESVNMVSSRGSLFTSDCIPPKHRQIIAVLTQLEKGGYMFSASLEFDFSLANLFGKWGASHSPEIHSGINQLHNPQRIN